MKRLEFFCLGLVVCLCIAAASPTMPPTRLAPGTGITITTNGLNNFTIASSGGVGTNNLNPNQFEAGTTNVNIKSGVLLTNPVSQATAGNSVKWLDSSGTQKLGFDEYGNLTSRGTNNLSYLTATNAVLVNDGASAPLLVNTNWLVVTNGNVGIGTALPSQKLDVQGSIIYTGQAVHSSGNPVLDSVGVRVANDDYIYWQNNAVLFSPASATLQIHGQRSGTTMDAVVFGGTTAAYTGMFMTNGFEFKTADASAYTNLTAKAITGSDLVTGTNGLVSYASNLLAAASITVTGSPFNWTNTLTKNVFVFFNANGSTTTNIAQNGTTLFDGTLAHATVPLQPGEYVTLTYSAGTPAVRWKPF